MKKYLQIFTKLLPIAIVLAGFSESVFSQTTNTYLYYNSQGLSSTGTLSPGTQNVIYSNRITNYANYPVQSTLTGISYNLNSNLIPSDLVPGTGISLWFSDKYYFDGTAQKLGTQPLTTGTSNILFQPNLAIYNYSSNPNISGYSPYFYITVDLATSAGIGKYIKVIGTSGYSVFTIPGFNNYSYSNTNTSFTIGTPSTISISSGSIQNSNPIGVGSKNNVLFSANVNSSGGSALLESLTLTTTGTYQSNQIAGSGFKLWSYSGTGNDKLQILVATAPGVASGGIVNFIPLSNEVGTIELNNNTNSLNVTVDISPTATASGQSIGILQAPSSAFVFESTTATGSASSSTRTISNSSVFLYSNSQPQSLIGVGSTNNKIQAFYVYSSSSAVISSVTITLSGTYLASDIAPNGFYLTNYPDPNYSYSTIARVSSTSTGNGEVLTFTGLDFPFSSYTYFYINADISPNAVAGHTILPLGGSANNIAKLSGTSFTGYSLNSSGVQLISKPAVAFSTVTPTSPTSIGANTEGNIIYEFSAKVSNLNAILTSLTLPATGTYSGTGDFSSFAISYNTTGDPSNFSQITSTNTIGGSLQFKNFSLQMNQGSTYYFFVTANINSYPAIGHNISLSGDTAQLTFATPITKTGSLAKGNTYTIGGSPSITISNLPLSSSTLLGVGTQYAPILGIAVTVSGGTVSLNNLTLTTGGTYTYSDINTFYLWESPTKVFNSYSASSFGSYGSSISTPIGESFSLDGYSKQLNPGVYYFFVTVNIPSSAQVGNTISVTGGAVLNFYSGTTTGILSSSSNYSISNPTVSLSTVSVPGTFIGSGSIYPIYTLRVNSSNGNSYLNTATFTTTGSYTSSDAYFYLYAGTSPSFDPNHYDYLDSKSSSGSGEVINFNNGYVLPSGVSYLYLIAYNNNYTPTNNSISVIAPTLTSFGLASGSLTGGSFSDGNTSYFGNLINISSVYTNPISISPYTSNNLLYTLEVTNNTNNGYSLNNLNLAVTGNVPATSISGLTLYYSNSGGIPNNLNNLYGGWSPNFTTATSIGFSPGSYINSNQTLFFYVYGSLLPTVTVPSNFTLTVLQDGITFNNATAIGTNLSGPVISVANPIVTVTTVSVPPASFGPNTFSNIVYVLELNSNEAALLSQITFDLSGSYTNNDINNITLWANNQPNPYNNAKNITSISSSKTTTAGGENINFNNLGQQVNSGISYLILTVDLNSNPKTSSTIKVDQVSVSGIQFSGSTATGVTNPGSVYTISTSTVTYTTPTIPANSIAPGSQNSIAYEIVINVSGSSTYLNSFTITTSGTYNLNDIPSFYEYLSTSSSFNSNNIIYSNYNYSTSTGSGEVFDFGVSTSLPVGTYYLYIVPNVSSNAFVGKNYSVNQISANNGLILASGTSSGTSIVNGGLQTIGIGSVEIGNVSQSSSTIWSSSNQQLLYVSTLTVTGAVETLSSINYYFNSTLSSDDILPNGYNIWINTSNTLTGATQINIPSNLYVYNTSLNSYMNYSLTPGTYYVFLTVDLSSSAVAGHTFQTNGTSWSFNGLNPSGFTSDMPVKTVDTLSSAKSLYSFSLSNEITSTITGNSILVTLPHGANLNGLIATFSSSPKSSVSFNSTPIISSVTSANYSGSNLIVTVVAENGTTQNYTLTINVAAITSADQNQIENATVIYPVPASDWINIIADTQSFQLISISNLTGESVYEGTITDRINVSNIPAGAYVLSLKGTEHVSKSSIIIVH